MNNIGGLGTTCWWSSTTTRCPFPKTLVRWHGVPAICAPRAVTLMQKRTSGRFLDGVPGGRSARAQLRLFRAVRAWCAGPCTIQPCLRIWGSIISDPIDGHNEAELERALRAICSRARPPSSSHVVTKKGKGYAPGRGKPRQLPLVFRPLIWFTVSRTRRWLQKESFSTAFGNLLSKQGSENEQMICAITAAMKYGTGLQPLLPYAPQALF